MRRLRSSRAEGVDAGVLQKPSHNAFDSDVFADSRQPRPETADAPDDELNLHPGLGRLVVQVDDVPCR